MATLYRVHPAIGICRMGNSESFFIGPEHELGKATELDAGGHDRPLESYKLGTALKRQAARFRVFEYEVSDDGSESLVGVVDGGARVRWTVEVGNTKASGGRLQAVVRDGRRVLSPTGSPRNASISARDTLKILPGPMTVSGQNGPMAEMEGQFQGNPVRLGTVTTDARGDLVVIGSRGASGGRLDEAGRMPSLDSYCDNDGWFDDAFDGEVRATVVKETGESVEAISSWVICGPPDFAPVIQSPVTLYDWALEAARQRGWRVAPAMPSFVRDVMPVLGRAASMKWTHDWSHWSIIGSDPLPLADIGNAQLRRRVYDAVTAPSMHEYAMPQYTLDILAKWRDGIFLSDISAPPLAISPAEVSDRISLESCIASSFFPGIEVGTEFLKPEIFAEPFRLSPAALRAGKMTEQMALPWQADFNDCRDDWWPSQRPNNVFVRNQDVPGRPVEWQVGVGGSGTPTNRLDMVGSFWKLGMLSPNADGNVVEVDRDAGLPPR